MKMEFSVKAPYAGVVDRIHVKEGQQLSPGDRFLDLKKDE
jgi:biotin carboxyl carrier protein